jgi:hypothetical protein
MTGSSIKEETFFKNPGIYAIQYLGKIYFNDPKLQSLIDLDFIDARNLIKEQIKGEIICSKFSYNRALITILNDFKQLYNLIDDNTNKVNLNLIRLQSSPLF